MFHHVKELQYDARVSGPDPRFATMLLEQFGGANSELSAAMQYFTQAFAARQPHPDKYDLLMDIATEEFSHLEIVGATITMLLSGINGQLKDAAEQSDLMKLLNGKSEREQLIQTAATDPQFFDLSGGGPTVTNSQGVPWSAAYIHANGDLTVDLRSDIAAESRAKIIYQYLLQFTNDPHVKDSLSFLMAREVAHMQMFTAALSTIQPNFPPGVELADPRYTHLYFNMSNGRSERGPWNQGQGPWAAGQSWHYIEDPVKEVMDTHGNTQLPVQGTNVTNQEVIQANKQFGKQRGQEVDQAMKNNQNSWSFSGKP